MPLTLKRFAQPYTETETEVSDFLNDTAPALAVQLALRPGLARFSGPAYRSAVELLPRRS
jgi:hypothetical protein